MNEPTLILLEIVVVDKNPPGKPADEGGNAWIKEIRDNGVKQKTHGSTTMEAIKQKQTQSINDLPEKREGQAIWLASTGRS